MQILNEKTRLKKTRLMFKEKKSRKLMNDIKLLILIICNFYIFDNLKKNRNFNKLPEIQKKSLVNLNLEINKIFRR